MNNFVQEETKFHPKLIQVGQNRGTDKRHSQGEQRIRQVMRKRNLSAGTAQAIALTIDQFLHRQNSEYDDGPDASTRP